MDAAWVFEAASGMDEGWGGSGESPIVAGGGSGDMCGKTTQVDARRAAAKGVCGVCDPGRLSASCEVYNARTMPRSDVEDSRRTGSGMADDQTLGNGMKCE